MKLYKTIFFIIIIIIIIIIITFIMKLNDY